MIGQSAGNQINYMLKVGSSETTRKITNLYEYS